jgi:hypothetical protein
VLTTSSYCPLGIRVARRRTRQNQDAAKKGPDNYSLHQTGARYCPCDDSDEREQNVSGPTNDTDAEARGPVRAVKKVKRANQGDREAGAKEPYFAEAGAR